MLKLTGKMVHVNGYNTKTHPDWLGPTQTEVTFAVESAPGAGDGIPVADLQTIIAEIAPPKKVPVAKFGAVSTPDATI